MTFLDSEKNSFFIELEKEIEELKTKPVAGESDDIIQVRIDNAVVFKVVPGWKCLQGWGFNSGVTPQDHTAVLVMESKNLFFSTGTGES